jgi:hypothetical protein
VATEVKEKTIEKGAEKVIDGLEDIAVAAPQAAQGINKGVLLVGGIVIGVSVGFLIAKKRLESKYLAMAEEEIAEIRAMYYQRRKLDMDADSRVKEAKKSAAQILEERGYTPPTAQDERYIQSEQAAIDEANAEAARAELEAEEEIVVPNGDEVVVTNVFHAGEIDEWDWDIEKTIRKEAHGGVPYVLHRDEYFENEQGYDQITLTYFEGDDVLADSHDTPVDDQDAMVGLGNLAKFGHGSGDPNTVYVRNDELQIEIEVIHSDGKFSEQRRGIPIEGPPPGDPRKRRSRGNPPE